MGNTVLFETYELSGLQLKNRMVMAPMTRSRAANEAAFVNDLSDPNNNTAEKAYIEINTNYISVIHFTSLLTPLLLQQEDAAIINISSIAVFRSNKYLPTYSASKAALHSYTEGLRDTFAGNEKLNVYEVYPPLVNTDFSAEIGGANGIPPSEVADELLAALDKNQFEVPVGETKIYAAATQEAFANIVRGKA
ncbi:SDR family NAD(P)-dependent oxidoreductase [Sphingobacterium olei]|uniref:SDR family NAD(P)-dependent oxidoreductase n=1 Tax=Sphingobacterium olei TaxID=2571155 RepID=UPI001EE4D258|nr:SDR family NAD(P)-dependent oxidoreductase [Sphingobacterium olei]